MIEYDRNKLGKILRSAREAAEYTQQEVSKKLGYTSSQFVSNIERGMSVVPMKTLARMIALYKANPETVVKVIIEGQQEMLRKKFVTKVKSS